MTSWHLSVVRLLLFFALGSPQASWATSQTCRQIFQSPSAPRSISHYLDQVTRAEEQGPRRTPRFLDPREEISLVPLWQGTRNGPVAIRETLLNETALLNFPLLAADAGAVKIAQPGNFTSMRLNHTWEGKNMSTNVGMPIDALLSRALSGESTLVPSAAKAVLIFMHGGGTKTTGHHVAAAISNFFAQYGVAVVSLDAPFHGYGPRVSDLKPLDYYRYLVAFRKQFIPASVPTFIGGHSMGGMHADTLMRLSDRPELGIREAFAGLINLSGPLDNAPGGSLREKAAAADAISRNRELMELVPEAERDLSVLLLTQGKSSALGGVSAETFMGLINWRLPEHGGRNYLPTLAVMGERDALYVGNESIFKQYIADLSNTQVHLIGQRSDFKGREDWVSHMIFDHYRPGTTKPEVFNLVKEFIEGQLGQSLETLGHHPLMGQHDAAAVGLLRLLVQEYYNNLAFRRFAHQYEIVEKTGTQAMAEMGQYTGELSRESRALQTEMRQIERQSPRDPRLVEMRTRLEAIEAELTGLRSQQQATYIPESGPVRDYALSNVQRRQELEALMKEQTHYKKDVLTPQLKQLREERARLQTLVDRAVQKEFDDPQIQSPELIKKRQQFEQALDQMVELQIRMNEANREMVTANIEQGIYKISPSPRMIRMYRDLDAAYARYNRSERQLRRAIESALARGEDSQQMDIQQAVVRLFGSLSAHSNNRPTQNSLLSQLNRIQTETEQLELSYSQARLENNQLLIDYVETVTPHLFQVRRVRIATELDRPLRELVGKTASIEKIWKDWVEIWKERPPEQGTSLY